MTMSVLILIFFFTGSTPYSKKAKILSPVIEKYERERVRECLHSSAHTCAYQSQMPPISGFTVKFFLLMQHAGVFINWVTSTGHLT